VAKAKSRPLTDASKFPTANSRNTQLNFRSSSGRRVCPRSIMLQGAFRERIGQFKSPMTPGSRTPVTSSLGPGFVCGKIRPCGSRSDIGSQANVGDGPWPSRSGWPRFCSWPWGPSGGSGPIASILNSPCVRRRRCRCRSGKPHARARFLP